MVLRLTRMICTPKITLSKKKKIVKSVDRTEHRMFHIAYVRMNSSSIHFMCVSIQCLLINRNSIVCDVNTEQ